MIKIQMLVAAFMVLLVSGTCWAAQRGVTEIGEGSIRNLYVDGPLVGAKGYVVGDWVNGQVRVEVNNFPQSKAGYEVFLFEIDIPAYMELMFIEGDKGKGFVSNLPPLGDVAALINQWYSLGDLEINKRGNGTLEYRGGENLYDMGLNMVFIFEKVTPGRHSAPEDFSKLMVECNGPLAGTMGSEGMEKALTVFSSKTIPTSEESNTMRTHPIFILVFAALVAFVGLVLLK